jgi:DNA-binding response OmpR family regulator
LQKCRSQRYDLLLMDLRMPVMNGLEMLSELRRDESEMPPAVVITAHGGPAELFEAAKLGAIDCVRKPFSIHAIRSRVRDVFDRFANGNLARSGPTDSLLTEGKRELMLMQCLRAQPLLEEAAKLEGRSGDASFLLGLCHLLQQRRDEAIAHMRFALYVDPGNAMAADYLAWLARCSNGLPA